ncbi:MAG TPA: hypothetical protein DEB56_13635 [Thiobacillus sp.]|nr:hypothetical protein [Thiobacillus sp.]
MRTLLLALVLLASPAFADRIKLDNAPLSNVVRLYFAEVNQEAYHLPDSIIKDERRVSLSIEGNSAQLRGYLSDILKGYGYAIEKRGGMYSVDKMSASSPGGVELETLIYRPKARTSQYLTDVMRHLYPSVSQAAPGLPAAVTVTGEYEPTSASAKLENRSDRLIFQGTPQQVSDFKRLVSVLDVATPSIELQVFLIEHTKTKGKQSGFAALVDKVGPFSLALGSIPGAGDVLRFASGGVQLAISALRTDNAFSVYTSPKLLLVDRKKARLVVGQDVPVLTSTTTTEQGVVQSIEYRSSGVIMEASANILDDVIEIDSTIEVSSFAETTTGVSMSPTLTKRALQSSTVLSDGSAVLFGGLNSTNQNEGSTGLQFLPRFLRTNSAGSDEKELFILMAAKRL